jgi:hypothetical protein
LVIIGVNIILELFKFGFAVYPAGKDHVYVVAPVAFNVVVFIEPLKF